VAECGEEREAPATGRTGARSVREDESGRAGEGPEQFASRAAAADRAESEAVQRTDSGAAGETAGAVRQFPKARAGAETGGSAGVAADERVHSRASGGGAAGSGSSTADAG